MPKNNKQITPVNNAVSDVRDSKDYKNLLQELQSILSKGQIKAYKAVDNIKVQTHWQLGERIVREELKHKDRADYGKYLIDNLTIDLNTSKRRLYEIVRFYRAYPIVRSLTAQLSWTHYVSLMEIDEEKKRAFYQNKSVLHSWSVRELKKQIKSKLYENTPQNEIEEIFKTKLPATEPEKIFKGLYDFSPLGLQAKNEKELENRILGDFELFLKELGEDFAILGRQAPIKIDCETHLIDIVLYHRGIPCVVLVDLKIGKLNSRDVGQMNKYVGYYKRNKQYEHEKDTIGLIICRDAGIEEIIYALDGLEKKIFVAKYKVKLPSEEKIKQALKGL